MSPAKATPRRADDEHQLELSRTTPARRRSRIRCNAAASERPTGTRAKPVSFTRHVAAQPRTPNGFDAALNGSSSGPGRRRSLTRRSAMASASSAATGRQRLDGRRPSGNTSIAMPRSGASPSLGNAAAARPPEAGARSPSGRSRRTPRRTEHRRRRLSAEDPPDRFSGTRHATSPRRRRIQREDEERAPPEPANTSPGNCRPGPRARSTAITTAIATHSARRSARSASHGAPRPTAPPCQWGEATGCCAPGAPRRHRIRARRSASRSISSRRRALNASIAAWASYPAR